jgi:uncharacterized repeat protein (TIGR03803 family)
MRDKRLSIVVTHLVAIFTLTLLVTNTNAQTFTTLHSFDGTDGESPEARLVQATDGSFYGTTADGGANDGGTVFKITASGTLTALYSFCSQSGCTDGEFPEAGLVQATNGSFYGTTVGGGTNGLGTVFTITASGTLTALYSFCSQSGCADGANPSAGLVATNGDFYGTTENGGANGYGTVFKITASGKLTTLHSFDNRDGAYPIAGLVQASNGDFYGTTTNGGRGHGDGTIFKITPSGTLTTLYRFCSLSGCTDGEFPQAGLIQAINGSLYGTTNAGGANGNGTVFTITPSGTLKTLHSFGGTDGESPEAGLVQATDGRFYGTTASGGSNGLGTVFKITAGGTLTMLHSIESAGEQGPIAGLIQATNGSFYGTTANGGTNGVGTVFSLSIGLGPFLETQTTSGKVGNAIKILGTNLAGATSAMFNGTEAVFEVVPSSLGSLVTTTVPTGASTGFVTVTTPRGTLTSNQAFRVTPQILSFTPPSAPAGTAVTITGVSLAQPTQVTFGGITATTFTVDSNTQVTAIVPAGARTGLIKITTTGGKASSPGSFMVTP